MSSARRNDPQVEASTSPPAIDRLSKLPMELLEKIFDAAYDDPYDVTMPTAPLSRTLLPLFDRYVWRTVKIFGDEQLAKVCNTLRRRPIIGGNCRVFSVVDIKSPRTSRDTLRQLFDTLPNLVELVVNDDSGQILDVLLPPNRQTVFPFMPTIKSVVCFCRTQRIDPYNPAYLASLASMTSLRTLELVFLVTKPVNAQPVLRPPKHFSVAPLDTLSITIMHGVAAEGLRLFVQGITGVRALAIKHYRDPPSLARILQALASPETVEDLQVGAPKSQSNLPAELKRLASLKRITFRGQFGELSHDSFEILRGLPLERIDVDKNSDISGSELLTLVHGPAKLPTLKRLHLDNVYGEVGDSLQMDSDLEDYGEECCWSLPKWTTAFRSQHCRNLVGAGDIAIDVEVSGTISSAWETENEWDEAVQDYHQHRQSYSRGGRFALYLDEYDSDGGEMFDSEDDEY